MILSSIVERCTQHPQWQQHTERLEAASSLPAIVCAAWALGLLFARIVVEDELHQRAQAPHSWPVCEQCGRRLRSKGFRPRQLMTLLGVVY